MLTIEQALDQIKHTLNCVTTADTELVLSQVDQIVRERWEDYVDYRVNKDEAEFGLLN